MRRHLIVAALSVTALAGCDLQLQRTDHLFYVDGKQVLIYEQKFFVDNFYITVDNDIIYCGSTVESCRDTYIQVTTGDRKTPANDGGDGERNDGDDEERGE